MPLLLLYISFFTVQLFFNFDIANNPGNATFFSPSNHIDATHQLAAVHKTDKAKSKKQAIRLNKRFSPKVIPSYNPFVVQAPFFYLAAKGLVATGWSFISDTFLLSQSFRGPPVVA